MVRKLCRLSKKRKKERKDISSDTRVGSIVVRTYTYLVEFENDRCMCIELREPF